MAQVEVHPKVLVLPSTPSGHILATPAQATLHFLLQGTKRMEVHEKMVSCHQAT